MVKYEKDDIATYWFVIKSSHGESNIQAWTDDKDMLEYYINFHKCKSFKVKKMTDTMQHIYQVINESVHDKIDIYNITIKNPNPKPGKEFKNIMIPMTETEMHFVNEECQTFCATRVPYSEVSKKIYMLKNKYQRALEGILFVATMRTVLAEESPNPILTSIAMDQLRILVESFPDNFGK